MLNIELIECKVLSQNLNYHTLKSPLFQTEALVNELISQQVEIWRDGGHQKSVS